MQDTRLLLLVPPLTQLNTPYPSTAYLTGFLSSRGYVVAQADLGIEMVLALFSREGLTEVFTRARARAGEVPGLAAGTRRLPLRRAAGLRSDVPRHGLAEGARRGTPARV